ncbi:MAG TPA: alkaline phosphatase family protein [Actinomycetota bacterium]|nr:alkaline phosphatase family protein [Actinomycetota bacterium]
MPRRARRVVVPVVAAFALLVPLVMSAPAPAVQSDQDLVKLACSLPHRYLVRTWNGFSPDRGPELTAIPAEPNFMGAGLPHVGPWDYIQHVPMFWYGPGHIKAQGQVGGNVTLADIAPTQAKILDFNGFTAPDGTALSNVIQPGQKPPKLVIVLVWDSAGINVLQKHAAQWPYLRSLIPQGTWFKDAYVGSSPTSTAQDHATIGTGAFPIHHGIVAHHFQLGGQDTTPYQIGPNFFVDPTFADIYDQAENNQPIVGMVATADIHLGMMGHGSFWNGGDRDVAMTRSPAQAGGTSTAEGDVWNLPKVDAPYYSVPSFLQHDESIPQSIIASVDRADGKLDGMWRNNDMAQLGNSFDTPARTVFEEQIVEQTIKNEHFGADTMPDLLYLNFKEIDYVGHVWSMDSPEMTDAVKYQDEALKRFIPYLNRQVGKDNWAMVITADHAAMPNPIDSGGFEISTGAVSSAIETKFDTNGPTVPIVDNVQPGSIFLNEQEVAANNTTIADIARYVQTLTQAETSGGGVTPNPGQENDPVFQAVFPSSILPDLPCIQSIAKQTQNIV